MIKKNDVKKDYVKFGVIVASAILKKEGKISIEQIEAIPLVEEKDVSRIISELRRLFSIEVDVEKTASEPYLEWGKIIRLKQLPA